MIQRAPIQTKSPISTAHGCFWSLLTICDGSYWRQIRPPVPHSQPHPNSFLFAFLMTDLFQYFLNNFFFFYSMAQPPLTGIKISPLGEVEGRQMGRPPAIIPIATIPQHILAQFPMAAAHNSGSSLMLQTRSLPPVGRPPFPIDREIAVIYETGASHPRRTVQQLGHQVIAIACLSRLVPGGRW